MKRTKFWTSKKADKVFSEKVRSVGVCQRPNCPYCHNRKDRDIVLQCSHFWGRNCSSTRYSFENCDCFCPGTHFMWENEKAGAYRNYMLVKLGEKGYNELEVLHNKSIKRSEVIKQFQKLCG
jgi:hypothetical protein